jgi:hypothetical protein
MIKLSDRTPGQTPGQGSRALTGTWPTTGPAKTCEVTSAEMFEPRVEGTTSSVVP